MRERERPLEDGTRCVRAGRGDGRVGEPLHAGPVLAAAYHLGAPGQPTPVDFYGRSANPTWRALEAAIGELDGGRTVLFASGMAAISAVPRLHARPGRALVLPGRRLLLDSRAGSPGVG